MVIVNFAVNDQIQGSFEVVTLDRYFHIDIKDQDVHFVHCPRL
jgi:hypothetical protein